MLSLNSREPSLIILGSYMRSVTINRQLILGISLPCLPTHIPNDQRRWNWLLIHILLRLSPSVRRVLLFSTRSLTLSNVIRVHKSPVVSLALNLLATSSKKGTVIRVWSVLGVEKLYQFHRGMREVRIWSTDFNLVGSLLAVREEKGTCMCLGWRVGKVAGKAG